MTIVDGSSRTGLYAADGSFNAVIAADNAIVGNRHACGALNVVHSAGGSRSFHAACGAMYVQKTPFNTTGLPVTIVSGSLP